MSRVARLLRQVSDPLGSYLRVTRGDHPFLTQMLVERRRMGTGLVADPGLIDYQRDLWSEARSAHLETVLDPRSLDLSTPGGIFRSGARDLPWAPTEGIHTPGRLAGTAGRSLVARLAEMMAREPFTAILAPTHLLDQGLDWLPVDVALARWLREALNRRGLNHIVIYYPLIVRGESFYDAGWRSRVKEALASAPIDAVWLRVHPFGTPRSGPLVLKRYMAACRDLHDLNRPLVGEHTGSIGVALMAFGALGGVESGITVSDHTDLTSWLKPPASATGGFGHEARVYFQELAAFVDRSKAQALLGRVGMKAAHGCRDSACCRRGWRDTMTLYREHFVYQRSSEVRGLSNVPENLRPGHYMEEFLRPATDAAARAAAVEPALDRVRRGLDSWRGTLGEDLKTHAGFSFSPPAAGRRLRNTA